MPNDLDTNMMRLFDVRCAFPVVRTVGTTLFKPRALSASLPIHGCGSINVLPAHGGYRNCDEQAYGVNDEISLWPLDLLPCIGSAFEPLQRGATGLCVDYRSADVLSPPYVHTIARAAGPAFARIRLHQLGKISSNSCRRNLYADLRVRIHEITAAVTESLHCTRATHSGSAARRRFPSGWPERGPSRYRAQPRYAQASGPEVCRQRCLTA